MKNTPHCIGSDTLPGLSKLIEEMGEAHQVIGKIMGAHGFTSWDGLNLKLLLEEELADVMAAMDFVIQHNKLNRGKMVNRAEKKFKKFSRWHKNIQAGRHPRDNGSNEV